ncbi:hypothetical protein B0H14DRAFT_3430264 [Mycena olivaceomarginata]|nr:hypothetical protein B0H14DRAFT_3430264 [Mycena olivaceomarginata]
MPTHPTPALIHTAPRIGYIHQPASALPFYADARRSSTRIAQGYGARVPLPMDTATGAHRTPLSSRIRPVPTRRYSIDLSCGPALPTPLFHMPLLPLSASLHISRGTTAHSHPRWPGAFAHRLDDGMTSHGARSRLSPIEDERADGSAPPPLLI